MMETKMMAMAKKKWDAANKESDIRKRDCLYHQTTILREFARFSEEFGEGALKEFFKEVVNEVQE